MAYIKFFTELSMKDIPLVGGKNASLGEMIQQLKTLDPEMRMRIPLGFAITTKGYWDHLEKNRLVPELKNILGQLDNDRSITHVQNVGAAARALIYDAPLPTELASEIVTAYEQLSAHYDQDAIDVAVRSSATAEDLPHASFAGQQDTYLNVKGKYRAA